MSKMDSRTKRKYLRYTAIVLVVVFCLSAVLLALALWENQNGRFEFDNSDYRNDIIIHNGEEYRFRDDIEVVLVIGLDKAQQSSESDAYNNDKSADFLLLLAFDNTKNTCKGVQINRDTIAEMNRLGVAGDKIGTVKQQIALSHTYGNGKEVSCRNTVDAVSQLLFGVKIHHYVSLTMEAVPTYNDLVGGVTLTVLDDLTSLDSALVKDAVVTLNGEQALTYVRGRYGLDEPTNIARMKRHRQYISALYEQSNKKAEADKSFSIEVAKSLSKYIVSDCTLNQMQTLYDKFAIYDFEGISEIKGESVVGEQYMEFYPDVNSMKQTVVELFYKKED